MNHISISGRVKSIDRKEKYDAVRISAYGGKNKDGSGRYFQLSVRVYRGNNGQPLPVQVGQYMSVSGALDIYEYNGNWYTEVKAYGSDCFFRGEPEAQSGNGADDDGGIPF